MLLFVVAENKQTPEWLELHHRQAASETKGAVRLPVEHYLYPTHAGEIADRGGGAREVGGFRFSRGRGRKRTTAVLLPP
ncbi:hypothetical protein [Arthrobacter sp. Leaf145]|uniref:hypothetical protein n=1 Tax=Paenarthrobacter nicotinovorans TaxID=29320 RepID=UPI0006FF023A|nr:hypothetical protein ASF74_00895 [Arthrobacter sp. Leaf145]